MIICAGCHRSTGGRTFACCGMGWCAVCYYDAHFVQHVLANGGYTMPPPKPVAPSPRMVTDGPRFAWWLPLVALALLAAQAFADAPAPKPRPRAVATPRPVPEHPYIVCGNGINGDGRVCNCYDESVDPRVWVDCPPTDPPEPLPPPVVVTPVTPPTSVDKANARGFHVDTQFGALATVTGETGTDVQPTFWINTDGPLALGSRSIGRLGARMGLTSSPGVTFNALDVKTYNAVEADLLGGYVIGAFKAVETMVVVEGGFASRVKGSTDPRPLNRLSRSLGIGFRFDARRSNASFVVKGGFDEATSSCTGNAICTGAHSGFALMFRGQVPIVKGAALFTGDCSLSLGGSTDWLTRRDILRVGLVLDPVEAMKVMKGTAK